MTNIGLSDPNEEEIRILIKKFEEDSKLRENILKKLDVISRNTRLYKSNSFMKFLTNLSHIEDRFVLSYFLYILHNLIRVSQASLDGWEIKLVSKYKKFLLSLFTS